jgi:copper transport protein
VGASRRPRIRVGFLVGLVGLAALTLPLGGTALAAGRGEPSTTVTASATPDPVVAPPDTATPRPHRPDGTPPEPREHAAVHPLLVSAEALGFAGMAVFVGGLAFLALLWPAGTWDRRVRRVLIGACCTGAVTTLAGIGLQGAYAGMLPLSDAFTPHTLGGVLTDHLGEVWAIKGLLWVLGAVVLAWALRGGDVAVRQPAWRVAALAVAFGLLRTTGMTGHAPGTGRPALSQAADLLHLTGVSLWFGGLVILLSGVLRRHRAPELAAVVPRYSMLALCSVLAIASSGLVLAWQLIGSVSGVLTTSYGHLLLAKLAVFALVLGAAQRSKQWVRARLDLAVLLRGDAATVRPFLYSVAIETALLCLVLLAATFLVTAAPGR